MLHLVCCGIYEKVCQARGSTPWQWTPQARLQSIHPKPHRDLGEVNEDATARLPASAILLAVVHQDGPGVAKECFVARVDHQDPVGREAQVLLTPPHLLRPRPVTFRRPREDRGSQALQVFPVKIDDGSMIKALKIS